MKIFMISPQYDDAGNDAYEALWPVGEADFLNLWKFDGRSKVIEWASQQPLVKPLTSGSPPADFPALLSGCLVLSDTAATELRCLLSGCGELLSLPSVDGRRFTVLNPLPSYDCLDQDATQGKKFSSGGWMRIERYVFRAEAVPNVPVFRIFDAKAVLFCTVSFKEAVEHSRFVGIEFREVWNDDGSPVDTIRLFDRVPRPPAE